MFSVSLARLAPKLRLSVLELMALQFPAWASGQHASAIMVKKQSTVKRGFKYFMSKAVRVGQEVDYVK